MIKTTETYADATYVDADITSRGAVVVGVDGSERNKAAAEWALARANAVGTPLVLVHVLDRKTPQEPPSTHALGYQQGWRLLNDLEIGFTDQVISPLVTRLAAGPVARTLIEAAAGESLLVVGRRGHGSFVRLHIGSTSLAVASLAPVPVIVVPDHWRAQDHADQPVVVGVDARDPSREALTFAFREAARRGVTLVVGTGRDPVPDPTTVAGIADPEETALLTEALTPFRKSFPEVRIEIVHRRSHPLTVLLDLVGPTQLLVLGRHSDRRRGGFPFGSVARAALQYAEVPVAIIPPSH